jgi:hypothetical protein
MSLTRGKIFCLGLSKTGTSSLTEALNLLGLRAIHYPQDERTFRELRAGRYRLPLLEEYDAVSDIPVAPFYAQFDAEYPGSKFILTVREREAWLRSCEQHWRLMEEWLPNFPEFARVHEFASACAYGSVGFSRARFAFAYDAHLRNVAEYFRGRESDLLVLDVCAGEGWEKLCPFLGLEAPDAPFPRANEWMHLLLSAARDIERVVPEGEAFILVDEQGFGRDFGRGRRRLPFLERDGQYWGAPADDATALAELERMRRVYGARYLAFGWPSFWWFEHYKEFGASLRERFPLVVENERLAVFDLMGGGPTVGEGAP